MKTSFIKTLQLSILFIIIGLNPTKAQDLGYINDPDGYTNVRTEPSGKSRITAIILEGQAFKYYPDSNSDWYTVEFKFRTGYIHKSRIKDFNQVKSGLNKFFLNYYSADRNNVELGEGNNEKLFMVTQNYPLATVSAFCDQSSEIQDFLISEYKSPIHDLIDLQLIYSRLISENPTCPGYDNIINALKVAAENNGFVLNDNKSFLDSISEYNVPDRYYEWTKTSFASSIEGKPIMYYLNHPKIDTYSKMYYQGQFQLSDNNPTYSILDSVLTDNPETRPFYLYNFMNALTIADGALAEYISTDCKQFIEKYPLEFIALKSNAYYSDIYEKWIGFAAFDYYCGENSAKIVTETFDSLKRIYKVNTSELDSIQSRILKSVSDW